MTTTRRTGAPASRGRAPVQQLRLKLVVFALLCALPVYGSALLWVRQGMMVPAIALTVMSLFAFMLYRHDKRQAGNGGQRTPENVLHTVELLGGWPGALLAQQVFRHKTRKVSFQVVFWLIVLVHQALWIDWLFLGKRLWQGYPFFKQCLFCRQRLYNFRPICFTFDSLPTTSWCERVSRSRTSSSLSVCRSATLTQCARARYGAGRMPGRST